MLTINHTSKLIAQLNRCWEKIEWIAYFCCWCCCCCYSRYYQYTSHFFFLIFQVCCLFHNAISHISHLCRTYHMYCVPCCAVLCLFFVVVHCIWLYQMKMNVILLPLLLLLLLLLCVCLLFFFLVKHVPSSFGKHRYKQPIKLI